MTEIIYDSGPYSIEELFELKLRALKAQRQVINDDIFSDINAFINQLESEENLKRNFTEQQDNLIRVEAAINEIEHLRELHSEYGSNQIAAKDLTEFLVDNIKSSLIFAAVTRSKAEQLRGAEDSAEKMAQFEKKMYRAEIEKNLLTSIASRFGIDIDSDYQEGDQS